MKYIEFFVLMFVILLLSCQSAVDKKLPKKDSFFLFKHVKEIVDTNTNVTIRFELLDVPLTKMERDTLIVILGKYGWPYKTTNDGEVLISEIAMGDLVGLFFLDAELYRRTHK